MIVNEVVQWAVILTLTVLVLGLYRQLAQFMGIAPLSLESNSGPRLGRPLDDAAQSILRAELDDFPPSRPTTLAFVHEGCAGCQFLLAHLSNQPVDAATAQMVIVVALRPSPDFLAALHELSRPVVADHTGDLWKACDVQATPFQVHLDRHGVVTGKAVDHNVGDALVP